MIMILYNFVFPANIDARYRCANCIGQSVGLAGGAGEVGMGTGENLSPPFAEILVVLKKEVGIKTRGKNGHIYET